MENHGEHKRDKYLMYYWLTIGLGLGIVIGASTGDMIISIVSCLAMGIAMALLATKKGVDNS